MQAIFMKWPTSLHDIESYLIQVFPSRSWRVWCGRKKGSRKWVHLKVLPVAKCVEIKIATAKKLFSTVYKSWTLFCIHVIYQIPKWSGFFFFLQKASHKIKTEWIYRFYQIVLSLIRRKFVKIFSTVI